MYFDKLYIDGQWVNPAGNDVIEVENPSNEEIIGSVPIGIEEDVDKAVKAAKLAFKTFKNTSLEERIKYIEDFTKIMEERSEDWGKIITSELGAPISRVEMGHILGYIKRINAFIDGAKDIEFESKLDTALLRYEPIGVVACLTPWNYPLGQIIMKVIPAILAGCTMVLKPSQKTPLIAFEMMKGFDEIGLPKGVLNLVSGRGSQVGNIIASHPDIDMISFTGSTSGGAEVAKLAGADIKRTVLELGGKSGAVLLQGGDIKLAVKKVIDELCSNVGQTCSAKTRLIAARSMKAELEEEIKSYITKFKSDDPFKKETNMGPLASEEQYDKVSQFIKDGIEEGAEILIGELPNKESKGYYLQPLVFTEVDNKMKIAQEEIFGPVLSVIYYDDIEEALEIVNDSIYGLSGSVFGPDEEALNFARKTETGGIYVNDASYDPQGPFGGMKKSGIGREGGKYGVLEYLDLKTIYL